MDANNELLSPETQPAQEPEKKTGTDGGLFAALVCALQLGLCAPAVAACVCTENLLAVTLELVGAALIAAGLGLIFGARLSGKAKTGLTVGIYALFALVFVWIHTGSAASAAAAMALAALCAFSVDAANARIGVYADGALWPTLPARLAAAVIPALALYAVSMKR